jgi:hypothetical protein
MPYNDLEDLIAKKHADRLPRMDSIEKGNQLKIRDRAVQNMIRDLKEKFEFSNPVKFKRHRHILLAFRTRDKDESGFLSVEDFRACLKLLNVDLPDMQFKYLIDELGNVCSQESNAHIFTTAAASVASHQAHAHAPAHGSAQGSGPEGKKVSYSHFMRMVDALWQPAHAKQLSARSVASISS